MKSYKHLEEVTISEIDKYLSIGYEIVETEKRVFEDGEERVYYHVGYPLETQFKELKDVISLYEQYGLKELLFSKIAESIGEVINDYDDRNGHVVSNEVTKNLSLYERAVNENPRVKYYKKYTSEEIELKFNL